MRPSTPSPRACSARRRPAATARRPRAQDAARTIRRGNIEISDEGIACTKAVCNYIYETYGRFPASVDTMHMMWFMQAHHLDLDYYAKFFHRGACSHTHLDHMRVWHPDVST